MDRTILVEHVRRVIDSFKNEGKDFSFVGLIPHAGNSYILTISAPWLETLDTNQRIRVITRRMFDLLDSTTLKHIYRIKIIDKNDFNDMSNDLILEDTIGYKDFYNRQWAQHDIMNYIMP